MSYTQKMRSWVLTILGALLAMLLWRFAQTFEHFTADELRQYSGELATFKADIEKAGKKLTDEESQQLADALKNDKLQEGLALIKTLRGKYLGTEPSSEDRLDILTNLIDDARKRIAAIEKQSADAKVKGEEAQAQINALSNPESLPGVDLNAAPVA